LWAISSATVDAAQASVNYTTQVTDAETNAWYAFGCDKVASVATCSPMTQGSGNTGSPFVVNHAPALGTVAIGPTCGSSASVDPGNSRSSKLTVHIQSDVEYGFGTAIQTDGKVLIAGSSHNGSNDDFSLIRTNADGSLDTTFNSTGKVTTAIGSGSDIANAVILQSDGKLLVAGQSHNGSNNDFALVRHNTDGTLDTTFNTTGKVATGIGSDDRIYSVALQSDGKIVATGYSDGAFATARYNTNGTLDTTFDTDGIVTTAVGGGASARGLAIQSDGKIVVGGTGSSGTRIGLVRYNANGSLDTAFGTNGIVSSLLGSVQSGGQSIVLQADGKIVVGGYDSDVDNNFTVARYTTAGALDTTFNSTGFNTISFGSYSEYVRSIALQSDGKIVAAGYTYIDGASTANIAIVRLTTGGVLDTTFSGDGMQTTVIGTSSSGLGLGLTTEGKPVVVGWTLTGTNYDFALVRFKSDGSLDDLSGYACVSAGVTDSDTANTANVYVCPSTTDHFNHTLNRCENVSNAEITMLCSILGAKSGDSAQCVMNGKVPVPTAHGSNNVLVYVEDSQSFPGTGTNSQSYTVTDVVPAIAAGTSYSTSDITLAAGNSVTKTYTVTVTDNNGGNDLTGATGILYDDDAVNLSSGTCNSGVINENNCYPGVSCTGGVPSGADRVFTCAFDVWFNANANNASGQGWRMHLNPADEQGAVTTLTDSANAGAPYGIQVGALQAIDIVETSLDYGPIPLGMTSAGQGVVMQNVGNQVIDVLATGDNMCTDYPTCAGSVIPKGQQKFHNTSATFRWDVEGNPFITNYGPGTEAEGCLNRDLAVRTDHTSTAANESVYLKILIPLTQSPGTYNGQDTFYSAASNSCTGTLY